MFATHWALFQQTIHDLQKYPYFATSYIKYLNEQWMQQFGYDGKIVMYEVVGEKDRFEISAGGKFTRITICRDYKKNRYGKKNEKGVSFVHSPGGYVIERGGKCKRWAKASKHRYERRNLVPKLIQEQLEAQEEQEHLEQERLEQEEQERLEQECLEQMEFDPNELDYERETDETYLDDCAFGLFIDDQDQEYDAREYIYAFWDQMERLETFADTLLKEIQMNEMFEAHEDAKTDVELDERVESFYELEHELDQLKCEPEIDWDMFADMFADTEAEIEHYKQKNTRRKWNYRTKIMS